MGKKAGAVLLALMLVLSLSQYAMALEKTGSIRVILDMQEGEVALFRVGTNTGDGYRLEESYGGGLIKEEDAQSPALAQWLAEGVEGKGNRRILDADGAAEYSNLEQGLYLLIQSEVQEGYYPIKPFLIALPYEGRWQIRANPKTESALPHTGQSAAPFLGAAGMVLSGTGLIACFFRRKRR